MKVTVNVIHDLLPAYVSGDASTDTVALVEEFLRSDPELARSVASLRANPLPDMPVALRPTQEKETLNMTKQLLRWRGTLMGFAIFLSLLPLSFTFDHGRVRWTFLTGAPPAAVALVCLGAVGCWGGFLWVRRRLEVTGL